jgi:hypothetical protein
MMEKSQKARCVHCRAEIMVPDAYSHGDHIKCGTCGMKHKVSRGDVLRLVVADVAPLKEALMANESLIERLEDEIQGARRSLGIGINGLGLGLIYFLYQVAFADEVMSAELAWQAVAVGLGTGGALELLNLLFFTKRQRLRRLADDLEQARTEGQQLQKMIRDAGRV